MSLINEMTGDTNGGVCLRYHLDYYTYSSVATGCNCDVLIEHIIEDIYIGSYLLPYINVNSNYIPTGETLELGMISIYDWVDDYINSLVTGGTIEDRIIHDEINDKYYYLQQSEEYICSGDTISRWAIVDYLTEKIWYSGDSSYYYSEIDECGNEIGKRSVKIKDINPMSSSFGNILIIDKCQNETEPLIVNNQPINVTNISADFSASILSDGGYPIIHKGFVYARHRNPTIDDEVLYVTNNLLDYTGTTNNLIPEKYYYVKPFAENLIGLSYGNSLSFITNS